MKATQFILLLLVGVWRLSLCRPLQYHFIRTAVPWLKAQAHCREEYTDLATVFDIEDMKRLVDTAQDSSGGFANKAWIGLHDDLDSWRWSFPNGEYGSSYRNWDFGQPDNFNGDQMCVKMWSGGVWEDSRCFLRNPFICFHGTAGAEQRFMFVEEEMSWPDAQMFCRGRYTDLASVRNQEENQQIQLLAKNRAVWIGLYRAREWSDGSDATFRYWSGGQPDNVGGKQECMATELGSAGRWSDEECGRELPFICYVGGEESPNETRLSSTTTVSQPEIITSDGESTRSAFTSPGQSTSTELDQPTPGPVEHVMNLRVKLSSSLQLSHAHLEKLVSDEFHRLLVEMGFPVSIKLGLRKPQK